ncbi:MAG TPA: DJ-1 family glyoxalase III, partial [Gammaproteobacteria bacterium]|nr:DJ-1 family glyoxalase III [Gammaproteobacteria bacterium]
MASVLVLLAEGCEETEAVTLIDLLRRAGVEVVTAGLERGPVVASRGVTLQPDRLLDEVIEGDFDMLVLPGGGGGADRLRRDPRVLELIRRHAGGGRWSAAICAAPRVLADAGVLQGHRATSFPGWLDGVPDIDYAEDSVVVDGRVATSRGPGTAMDFGLQLVELLMGREVAVA